MSVYTDGAHLVADSLEELHSFALAIGLKRVWFQDHERHPHYDLTSVRIAQIAIRAGAFIVTSRQIVKIGRGDQPIVETFDGLIWIESTAEESCSDCERSAAR